ncbi:hypothetical protein DXO170_06830 [Xanthomonas oryzae pv. oryzae]|uniref:Uncharacterized protein n=1 Tax=Xanthomonas oryzae pv. oryzae TaxID=64187 RepID=A0A854CIF5_XANOO|nr:hypothetical protein ABM06_02475 [Xanthomonas oryzae pv. oryzae]AZK82143.1 hypothetical protein BO992_02540 [Xanthomonas oryzae pv. oryzae]AZK86584.1 hypothetical protein BO993_05085 [Xanthomonas oryzae pv. oryzae]OLG30970.1 hypothetical protein BXO6_16640 [Xanthomonas oryzae pv. oryzae]OLG32204.1 hypothetical protein BXO2_16750 [Xanthomonas oryzae pv. oryzae]
MAAQAFNAIGQTLWFSLALGNFIARLLDSAKFALVSIYLACSGLRLLPLKQGGLKSQVQHLERPAVSATDGRTAQQAIDCAKVT